MTNLPAHSKLDTAPFIELLKDAESVSIRELSRGTEIEYVVAVIPKRPAKPEASAETETVSKEFLYRNAELLMESEDFFLARNIYSFLLKENLRDSKALRGFGICFFKLGDLSSAKKCFLAAWEIQGNLDLLLWLAQCSLAQRDPQEALQFLSKITQPALLSNKERCDYHREKGNCHARLGDFDTAGAEYRKALEVSPRNDTVLGNLGNMELQRNHWDLAKAYFERAYLVNRTNARALCGLGMVAMHDQDWTRAERFFFATLDVDVKHLIAIYQLVELADQSEQRETIKERFLALMEKNPKNVDLRFGLAAVLFRGGAWRDCDRQLCQVLEIEPQHRAARELKEEIQSNRVRT